MNILISLILGGIIATILLFLLWILFLLTIAWLGSSDHIFIVGYIAIVLTAAWVIYKIIS
jgi:hypothetical protein